MKNRWNRLLSAALALILSGTLVLPALADSRVEDPPAGPDAPADYLSITVGDYTPRMEGHENIQAGQVYTLIALPRGVTTAAGLSAFLSSNADPAKAPLYIGSAVASANGQVTFSGVRLRTAQAADYFVAGPGLATPLMESTSPYTSVPVTIQAAGDDRSATLTLVDAATQYAYDGAFQIPAGGSATLDNIAPGSYQFLVTKPGYLPQNVNIQLSNSSTQDTILTLAPYVGDVNNDGSRGLADLTWLLRYYGRSTPAAGSADFNGDGVANASDLLTPDLNSDTAIDQADVSLLVDAANQNNQLPTGSGTVNAAAISWADTTAADSAIRRLSLSVTNGGSLSVTAGSFDLTYQSDVVRPCNASGGLISPADGGTIANCLVPANGVTVSLTRWKVEGSQVTLSFALTAQSGLLAAGKPLVDFCYRPVQGKTADDFFAGVFALPHAAVLVGQDAVLTQAGATLTYPNSDAPQITGLQIDQGNTTLTIPAAGRTVRLPLTVTGNPGTDEIKNLPGVSWSLSGDAAGVSIQDGLLTVTDAAQPGSLTVTASRDGHTSSPLTVTLENAPSVVTSVEILKDSTPCNQDSLSFDADGTGHAAAYTAAVKDQYGKPMTTPVAWSLSAAPVGVTLSGGTLSVDGSLPAGTYSFSLLAESDGVQSALAVELTLAPVLDALTLSGPASAAIPAAGADALELSYALSAVDRQGRPMSLADLSAGLTLQVSPADQGVAAQYDAFSGVCAVSVSPEAQPGAYTLTATQSGQVGGVAATFILTLLADKPAVRAAVYWEGAPQSATSLALTAGEAHTVVFTAQLLDAAGSAVAVDSPAWTWTLSGSAPAGVTLVPDDSDSGRVKLALTAAVPPGSYPLDLTAAEGTTGLAVTLPVTLTVTPVLSSLTLSGPAGGKLSIPAGEPSQYTLSLTALDSQNNPLTPPAGVKWSVAAAEPSGQTPTGVSIQGGVLTLEPNAVPGVIQITAQAGGVTSAPLALTLEPAAADRVLVLYRKGALCPSSETLNIKEGEPLALSYTPMALDRATGQATELPADQIAWRGAEGGIFQLDGNAETGPYPVQVTATYSGTDADLVGQSASAAAQVMVYPDVKGLRLDFGDADLDNVANQYSLAIPAAAPRTYTAQVIAVITRGGSQVRVPLSQLGLTDYTLTPSVSLTGVYYAYDPASCTLALTVDPVAVQNSMDEPADGYTDYRYLRLTLKYFPGEAGIATKLPLRLVQEEQSDLTAVLRRGVGSGTSFAFDTVKTVSGSLVPEVLTLPAGSLSNCYALELTNQYHQPVTGKKVTWTLVDRASGRAPAGITLEDSATLSKLFSRYTGLKRLKVSSSAVPGDYALTLTAAAEGVSMALPITLTVTEKAQAATLEATGPASLTIPRWYYQYNSTTLNTETRAGAYTAVLKDANGQELDPSDYRVAWSVTDSQGDAPAGVTLGARTGASTTLTVSRLAAPDHLEVTASVTDPDVSGSAPLELNRTVSVPTLMTIRKRGSTASITGDAISLSASDTDSKSQTYTFHLVDQYNQEVTDPGTLASVKWTSGTVPAGAAVRTTAVDGAPAVILTLSPGKAVNTSLRLTAQTSFKEPSTTSGEQTVFAFVNVSLSVKVPGGTLGGGPAGPSGPTGPTTPVVPPVTPPPAATPTVVQTVYPPATQSGTAGYATISAEDATALTSTLYTGTLTVAPTGGSGLTSMQVTIPADAAKTIAGQKKQSLRVQTPLGTVLLAPEDLLALSASGDPVVTVSNQSGQIQVAFRSGSSAVSALPSAALSAPVSSGNVALAVTPSGGEKLLKKAVVENGKVLVHLDGPATLKTETRGRTFSDTQNHWAKDAVTFVSARDLFQGTSADAFSPEGNMTRSMVVTVLHRLEDTPAASPTSFYDVPAGTWYTDAVSWANASGIVQGNGAGFSPDDPVTREQLALILYRYAASLGMDTSGRASLGLYPDRARLSPWAQEAMQWAVSAGLINGQPGNLLAPGGNASRAEVATILKRFIQALAPSV